MAQLLQSPISSLFPSLPTQILIAKSNDPLSKTLKTLVQHKIHSAPVFDEEKNTFSAFVDLIDFAAHLSRTYIENEIIEGSVSRMLQEEKHYTTIQVANESNRNPWLSVPENSTIVDVLRVLVDKGAHRTAVSSPQNELRQLVTQSDLIRFIHNNLGQFSDLSSSSLQSLGIAFKEVISVPVSEKVWKSFVLMNKKGVSGVGVVDDKGQLIGHIGGSDLKGIEFDAHMMDNFRQSIQEFKPQLQVVSVGPTASFADVVNVLVKNKTHRVYIQAPDSKIPLGVVSQTDILRVVLNRYFASKQ